MTNPKYRRRSLVEERLGEIRAGRVKPGRDPSSGLARFYHKLLAEMNIDMGRWDAKVRDYLAMLASTDANFSRKMRTDPANERGNIGKELLSDKMTWKVFCKGILFLGFPEFKLTIELKPRLGQTITSSMVFRYGKRVEDESSPPNTASPPTETDTPSSPDTMQS